MDKRVQCFICTNTFGDVKDLFVHVKEVHNRSGKSKFTCTCACREIFTQFGAYKTHVNMCFRNMVAEDDATNANRIELIEAYNAVALENEDVTNFRESIQNEAFKLTCKLNANMILPRKLVYEITTEIEQFLQFVTGGMNRVIIPRVLGPEKRTAKDFVEAVGSSFSNLTTEWKFEKLLKKAGLIEEVVRCEISDDPFESSSLDNIDAFENNQQEKETLILMPISFQIKKFFELPGVFKAMIENAAEIKRKGKLNHFINGSVWKEKMKSFDEKQIVIPYFYYSDGAQLNHPLGPHIRKGSEDFQYYSFPTIPFQYQSRLENIFLSYLFPERFYSEYKLDQIFSNLIDELTKLATDGILVNVDGTDHQVLLVCGAFLADTKESNIVLGFARSPNANKYCRF